MLRVFLDACVLAMPQPPAEPGGKAIPAFESYVTQLLELNEARRRGFVRMFLPRDAEQALYASGLYPLWDGLATALATADLRDSYQPQDIVSVVDGLLKQLPRLEDTLGIDALLADPADLKPWDYLEGCPACLATNHRSFMLLVCLLFRSCGRSSFGDFVVVHRVATRTLDVNVRGKIEDWVLLDAGPCQSLNLPVELDDHVALTCNWSSLLTAIDPVVVWRTAETAQEREFAFRSFLFSFADANGIASEIASSTSWSFGASFLGSVDSLGFGHERRKIERLLSTMAETVLKFNLDQTHQLRTGKAGNNPQVKRGQDSAWRRDIDYEFHLHFWSTLSGVEFAATVAHNDFTIPE